MDRLKYAVLGSGSKANAYIFEYGDFSFCIDNGFSCREFLRRAELMSFDVSKMKLILLTHTHGDHIRGVGLLSKKLRCPVYKHHRLRPEKKIRDSFYKTENLVPGKKTVLDAVQVIPFTTSHDAPFPLGYSFLVGGKIFTLITDTGVLSENMFTLARESDVVFLEANHSREMLINGPYPEVLRRRILSERGHLSNDEAGCFVDRLIRNGGDKIGRIYFCHLSEVNNSPETAEAEITLRFDGSVPYRICKRNEMVEGIVP